MNLLTVLFVQLNNVKRSQSSRTTSWMLWRYRFDFKTGLLLFWALFDCLKRRSLIKILRVEERWYKFRYLCEEYCRNGDVNGKEVYRSDREEGRKRIKPLAFTVVQLYNCYHEQLWNFDIQIFKTFYFFKSH